VVPQEQGTGADADGGRGLVSVVVVVAVTDDGSTASIIAIIKVLSLVPAVQGTWHGIQCRIHRSGTLVLDPRKQQQNITGYVTVTYSVRPTEVHVSVAYSVGSTSTEVAHQH
jgi:hypothetical protein